MISKYRKGLDYMVMEPGEGYWIRVSSISI